MTPRELAIARSVIYASLFDYPLTLAQLHHSLIESDQSPAEILAVYDGSARLQTHRRPPRRLLLSRPAATTSSPSGAGAKRAATRFLQQHDALLRLLCALPFTRLVALSGSIAHLNLEPRWRSRSVHRHARPPRLDGDGGAAAAHQAAAAAPHRLRELRPRRLAPRARAAGSVHREPGAAPEAAHRRELLDAFLAANPFVARFYPNAHGATARQPRGFAGSRAASSRARSRCWSWCCGCRRRSSRWPAAASTRGTCGGDPRRGDRRIRSGCSPTT